MRGMKGLGAVVVPLCALLFACTEEPAGIAPDPLQPAFARKGGGGGGDMPAGAALLGQRLFEDRGLSVNGNQSCQTCHEPSEGFAAALTGVTTKGSVVEGSVSGRFGDRKPPSAAYATLAPVLSGTGNSTTGGVFWDGRATGAVLGNPAADQALGPFLNPKEQAFRDEACVVYRVRQSVYLATYSSVWGDDLTTIAFPKTTGEDCALPGGVGVPKLDLAAAVRDRVTTAYYNIARSIQAHEATFNKFSSRFDAGELTPQELEGSQLFGGKAKCQQCHSNKGTNALFTDFKYHNLGVPKNPQNPVYDYSTAEFDKGLGGVNDVSTLFGRFRTPTIRNTGMGANRTYMHNGVLTSLKQVVDFYNTRDVLRTCSASEIKTLQPAQYGSYDPDGAGPLTAAGCWPPAEHNRNLDTKNMGNLGLSEAQVDAIVAYMMAMNDR
ncbi:MAG TPA: cytochrome c peroxidase [Longimicrobiales bacterium]|nr:cytochrome c peroxidase [Longimicrobiales bacterium]